MSELQNRLMNELRNAQAAGDVLKRVELVDAIGEPYGRRQVHSALDSLELKDWINITEIGYVELGPKAPGP